MTDLAAPPGAGHGDGPAPGAEPALDLLFWLMVLSSSEAPPRAGPDPADKLTGREREIAALVCRGLTNKEIGRDLAISPSTVKNHMHAIHSKLGIDRRTKLPDALRGALEPG
jgi:DNA-binding NarL/FixJ family response regulator